MSTPDTDELIDRLEKARGAGRPPAVEQACAAVRLPYREGMQTGWTVLFYKAEDEQ